MFSTTSISTMSHFPKEDKLRTKFKRKCEQLRQGIAVLDSLWEVFLQGFEMLEKYKYKFPETVAECAVDLTETYKIIFPRCITPKDRLNYDETFYKITPHLAQLLSAGSNIYYRTELLNVWSEIAGNISNNIRRLTFLEQTESVIIVIIQCVFFTGNYFTQLNGLELVLRYLKSVDRLVEIDVLDDIMPCVELRDILLDFRLDCFDEDSRTFLNIFNMKISDEVPVFSIVAFSGEIGTLVIRKPMVNEIFEQPLWIDFNSSNHSISFFCERKTFFPEQNTRHVKNKNWILVEISIDQIILKEELCLLHIKASDKIQLIPPSFVDDLRFDLEEIKEITLQFSLKNLILIKRSKIIEFMNSKKNLVDTSNSQSGAIGFNIFHQFKGQKTFQKQTEKKSSKKQIHQIATELEKTNNKNDEITDNNSILKNYNDNFSNLKSSLVVPETISLNSKQTSKITEDISNKNDLNHNKSKLIQKKHMSRKESFETKCFVKLSKSEKIIQQEKKPKTTIKKPRICKLKNDTAGKSYHYALRSSSKLANEKEDKLNEVESIIDDVTTEKKLKNLYNKSEILQKNKTKETKNNVENKYSKTDAEINGNSNKSKQIEHLDSDSDIVENDYNRKIEHSVEIHNSPKSKIGQVNPRVTNELISNCNLRLVNMVRPLAKDKKLNQNYDEILSTVPPNPITVNSEQINDTVKEYTLNKGYIGITNKLKNKYYRSAYTTNELETIFDNLKEIHTSIDRTTKKIFKSSRPEKNVYDFEKSNKNSPKSRQKEKRVNLSKNHIVSKFLGDNNKNVNYSYKKNIKKMNENKFDSTAKKEVTKEKITSQVYDLVTENTKQKNIKNDELINKLMKFNTINENNQKLVDDKTNNISTATFQSVYSLDNEISINSKNKQPKKKMVNKNAKLENINMTNVNKEKTENLKRLSKKRKTTAEKKLSPDKESKKQKLSNHNLILNKDAITDETTNVNLENIENKMSNSYNNQKEDNLNNNNNNNDVTLNMNTTKNINEELNEKPKTFSQKIRNLKELIETNKKSRNSCKSLKNYNKCYQTSESSKLTDSRRLIINTSISTPNNLHSDRYSNTNQNNDENNEITITPNQICDKTWLYEKFLNDVDNNINHDKSILNINSNESKISIEPIRHAPSKINSNILEMNNNYLTYTKNISVDDEEEYPNDSVSIINENDNINPNEDDADKAMPLELGQFNLNNIQYKDQENIENDSSNYTDLIQEDSSWRDNTSSKTSSIVPQTNNNVEIIETKTIRIDGKNRTEERRVALKRRYQSNERTSHEGDPFYVFKNELHKITNDISSKYQNISKYPNEMNLQKDIEIYYKKTNELTKQYNEANKRMHSLRKKLKIEENICINSIRKSLNITEKLTCQLQNRKNYFEKNTERNKNQFSEILSNFKDSGNKLRCNIWTDYMDNFVQGFITNMKKFYIFDEQI